VGRHEFTEPDAGAALQERVAGIGDRAIWGAPAREPTVAGVAITMSRGSGEVAMAS
jgi:hypothetical protein